MTPIETVNSLFKSIEANDRNLILAHFHEDAVFHNMPMEEAVGHEAIWQAFAPIHDICTGIQWQVHNMTADDRGCVYTERTDRYRVNDIWCEFAVMGIHEIDNGKVRKWRDYFDLQQVMAQLSAV